VKRQGRKVRALHTSHRREKTVKCNICDQDFANSEELKAHKERDHTLEERQDSELESPDMMAQEEEQAAEGPPAEGPPVIPGKNN
jgi:hypothetical protein